MPVGLRAPAASSGGSESMELSRLAMENASVPHHFFGVTAHGISGIVHSSGNLECSTIVLGGTGDATDKFQRIMAGCAREDSTTPPVNSAIIADCGGAGCSPTEQMKLAAELIAAV